MNYLISAYSVNPYHGSEDGVGWNWVLQYEKNYKAGDRIILLTKKYNEEDPEQGTFGRYLHGGTAGRNTGLLPAARKAAEGTECSRL